MADATLDRGDGVSRILVAEDYPEVREVICEILRTRGYEVASAADGAEALELLGSFAPDLLITDYVMPKVDGVDLVHRVRANPEYSALPVILYTAYARDTRLTELLGQPAVHHMLKGSPSQLIGKVQEVLKP